MFKPIVSSILGYIFSFSFLMAQTIELSHFLESIEQNNPELIAFQAFMNSQRLAYQAENKLPDPQAGAYYLPWGVHSSSDYTEFQLTQSFEFPSVYSARKAWIEEKNTQLDAEYQQLRQSVLLRAARLWQEWIYIKQKQEIETQRIQQARQVFEQIETLFDKEEKGILEYNKAKMVWMQHQFALRQIQLERERVLNDLTQLNGGNTISERPIQFEGSLEIIPLDTLWEQHLNADPGLNILKVQETVAFQNLRLSRQQNLPKLTFGVNYQGLSGDNYTGLFGGFSIPLWSNQNRKAIAESRYLYQQSYSTAQRSQKYAELQNQYQQFRLLLNNYQEYQQMLAGLNSEALLLQAYELEQISFLDFYMELQFYQQAFDKMREMEWSLYTLKTELFKYQL